MDMIGRDAVFNVQQSERAARGFNVVMGALLAGSIVMVLRLVI
jgi:hypothetical protein